MAHERDGVLMFTMCLRKGLHRERYKKLLVLSKSQKSRRLSDVEAELARADADTGDARVRARVGQRVLTVRVEETNVSMES